jgi:hypothetical protein
MKSNKQWNTLSIEYWYGGEGGEFYGRFKHSDHYWVHCSPLFSLGLFRSALPSVLDLFDWGPNNIYRLQPRRAEDLL